MAVYRRSPGGTTGTCVTNLKWPLGGLSNLFIFISGWLHIWTPYSLCKQVFWKISNKQICVTPWECLRIMQNLSQKTHARHSHQVLKKHYAQFLEAAPMAKRLRALFLNHSIISPLCLLWVRAPLWPHVRQALLLAGVSGVFSRGSSPHLHVLIGPSHMS